MPKRTGRPDPNEVTDAVKLRNAVRALVEVSESVSRPNGPSINRLLLILSNEDSTEVERKTGQALVFLDDVAGFLESGVVDDSETPNEPGRPFYYNK